MKEWYNKEKVLNQKEDTKIINQFYKISMKYHINLESCKWIKIMEELPHIIERDDIGPSPGAGKVRFLNEEQEVIFKFDELEDLLLFYEDGISQLHNYILTELPRLSTSGTGHTIYKINYNIGVNRFIKNWDWYFSQVYLNDQIAIGILLYYYKYYHLEDTMGKKIHDVLVKRNISNLSFYNPFIKYGNKMHAGFPEILKHNKKIYNLKIIEINHWYKKQTFLIKPLFESELNTHFDKIYSNDFLILRILTGYGSTSSHSSLKEMVVDVIQAYQKSHQIEYISFPLEDCTTINKENLYREIENFDKDLYYANKGIVYVLIYKD